MVYQLHHEVWFVNFRHSSVAVSQKKQFFPFGLLYFHSVLVIHFVVYSFSLKRCSLKNEKYILPNKNFIGEGGLPYPDTGKGRQPFVKF